MIIGACVTLGLISLRIALNERPRAPHFFFSFVAFAVAAISMLELLLMRTTDLAEYDMLLRWAVVPVFIMVASIAGFIWTFFNTGHKWLAIVAVALNAATECGSLVFPASAIRHAVALHQVELAGVTVTVPSIANGPGNIIGLLSVGMLLVFILDASIAVWRRGERRRAIVVGGGIILFLGFARGQALLVESEVWNVPYMFSFSFVCVLIAMAYELSDEVLSAARLSRKLRESEQRMNLAAEAAKLGLWVWDIARDEVWITDAGRTLFAFDPGQSLNYNAFSQRIHAEDRQKRDHVLKQTIATRLPYSIEYRVTLPDGTLRWIASRGRCVDGENDKSMRLMGVLIDITAQKQAEFQFQRQREEVAHLSRVSMMGQLASALAHELNQPLGAILRNAEAAELFLESDQPDLEELRAIIADIRKDDQRAGDVIDRLRTLLKRRNIESVPITIEDLLHDVATLTRADAIARQVTLNIEVGPGLPLVQADRVHLQQVLINLLLNAMDAMNGITVTRKRVVLRAKSNGNGLVEIAVSDMGHGIDEARLPSVFEPFFTTKAQGMGMGLAISRTIVEAHGGTISAENNPDGGATFRFTLAAVRNGVKA